MKAHFIFFISLAALQQVCAKNLNCNIYKLVYPLPLFRATKFTMLVCQFISTSIMQKCNSRMCISTSITPKVYVGLWGTCMTSRAALSVPTMSFPSFNLTAATLLNEMEMWTQCVAPETCYFCKFYQDISECNYTNSIGMSEKKVEKVNKCISWLRWRVGVVVFCICVLCAAVGLLCGRRPQAQSCTCALPN